MIVFDLKCAAQHRFEAWFGSSADYESQLARGLIACPLCDSHAVEKAAMAPAVPTKGNRQARGGDNAGAQLLAKQREMEASSEWVGGRFAEEARALHARGEARTIHGEASLADARGLIEDGVPVMPLPFRPIAKSDA
jgi:hypothetical protein